MDVIDTYVESFLKPHHPTLVKLDRETETRDDLQSTVGFQVGRVLAVLIRLTRAQHVLEFGTSLGFSTICLAQALAETGGKLTAVELREDLCDRTRQSLEKVGLCHAVDLIQGDAAQVAETLQGPYDLILQDCNKSLYPTMLERTIELTRIGGLIVADDALFKPKGMPRKHAVPVHAYNKLVFQDSRLFSTILPIGDGLIMSVKLKD